MLAPLDKVVLFIAIAIIIYYLWRYYNSVSADLSCVHGRIDILAADDSEEAIQIIAELDHYGHTVIETLEQMLLDGEVPNGRLYFVNALVARYNGIHISEGRPDGVDTSYVLNKDEDLILCIRDADMKFHDMELLRYVLLHEMSHMGTIEIEHEREFLINFAWLQMAMISHGLFVLIDFSKRPTYYCNKVMLS